MTQVEDTRIVYGAGCSWWDSISAAGSTASGLPCCPHCGSPLFEVASEGEWWAGVDRHEATALDGDGYRAFVEWLRGRHFTTLAVARARYEAGEGS